MGQHFQGALDDLLPVQRTRGDAEAVRPHILTQRQGGIGGEVRIRPLQIDGIERITDQVRGRHQGSVQLVLTHHVAVARRGRVDRALVRRRDSEERRRPGPAAGEQKHHLAAGLVGETAHARHRGQHRAVQLLVQAPREPAFQAREGRAHHVLHAGAVLPDRPVRARQLSRLGTPEPGRGTSLTGDLLPQFIPSKGQVGYRLEDRLGFPVALQHLLLAEPLQAVGLPAAGPVERLSQLVLRVRPGGQRLDRLAVEGDSGHPVRRVQAPQVLLQAVEHPVPVALDREQVVDEDEEVRAHRSVRVKVRHAGHRAGGASPGHALVDLGEVADRHPFAVDQQFEVRRVQAVDPLAVPVGDDDLDVHDANVDHLGEDGRHVVLPGGGRDGGGENEQDGEDRARRFATAPGCGPEGHPCARGRVHGPVRGWR